MKIFGRELTFRKPEPKSLPLQEEAMSQDALYSYGNQTKYNPDDLIGKKGLSIYRKMMLDEQVKAVVRFKRDAITSRAWSIEVDREALGDEEADRRIELTLQIIKKMKGSFTDALNGILSSMYQGMSMTEKVFNQFDFDNRTYWGIKALKLRPFDTFEFKVDDHGTTEEVIQKIGDKEITIDLSKFIHFTHNPEYDEHYGQSELRECHRPWFNKDQAYTFWNMWLERHASGFKWITPVNGKTLTLGSVEYNNLVKVLNNTVNAAGMILPSNIEFHMEFPTNNVAFKEAMEAADLAIAKALLVPNLVGITPSGQTGSYSQSDTQLKAFFWTLHTDTKRLEETVNEQLFQQLGEINFGDDHLPYLQFNPLTDTQINELLNTWAVMLEKDGVTKSDTDEAYIRNLMGFPEKAEDAEDENEETGEENEGEAAGAGEEEELPDETIRGSIVNVAFSRAQKRVDFAVISNASQALEKEHADSVAIALFNAVEEYIASYKEAYPAWDVDKVAREVKKLKFNPGLVSKVNKSVRVALKDGWNLGQKHAEVEIDKAKRTNFSAQADIKRVKFISEDFFKNKSFKVAGDLTDDAKKKIETIIINGAKTGKTTKQIEDLIYAQFASDGLLAEDMVPMLQEALAGMTVKNPQARIDTMIRTNLFDAINEARYSYFTDPALDGFVEALEYSAILDSRTTHICSHLDGQIHAADSEVWQQYRPPNHFNCRSLLIPVTVIDQWSESDQPTVDPQRGFA